MPGKFTNCKAIGWYVDDYKRAQISINLTNYNITSMHEVFDEASKIAESRGLRVTGSEVVGVLPKKALIDAGIHYLKKQGMSTGQSEKELIKIAIQSLGLNDVAPFNPEEKIIEYMIKDEKELSDYTISDFSDLLASDAPAPGGGSVAALCGNLASALGSMVANLTYNKKGYKEFNSQMDKIALTMQQKRSELSNLINEDTQAFNKMMKAIKQLKNAQKSNNQKTIDKAQKEMREANEYAIKIPMQVLKTTNSLLNNIKFLAINGNKNAVSDAGVSALLIQSAVKSAGLNVKINLSSFNENDEFRINIVKEMNSILDKLDAKVNEILEITEKRIEE
jgi:glutamate formiminotransferase/formiminotetrahydrofolate cyclodeaminase